MATSLRTDDEIIGLLQEASSSTKIADFEAALKVFTQILAEDNPNVTKFAASVKGMMGECLFSLARLKYVQFSSSVPHPAPFRPVPLDLTRARFCSEAVDVTHEAIKLCEVGNDDEGVVTCLVNLYETHRYAGNTLAAAKVARELSCYFKKLGSEVPALNYEKQANIIEKGEPLNRVVAVLDGLNYELEGANLHLLPPFSSPCLATRVLHPSSYFTPYVPTLLRALLLIRIVAQQECSIQLPSQSYGPSSLSPLR